MGRPKLSFLIFTTKLWEGFTVAIHNRSSFATGLTIHQLFDILPILHYSLYQKRGSVVDGALFRLTSEAYRIRLVYLFDPLIAVHTSLIEPLPHQITAVYETMLGKQPLRYLLADDPGAGKTIMTGLLIKELRIVGELRCSLLVSP